MLYNDPLLEFCKAAPLNAAALAIVIVMGLWLFAQVVGFMIDCIRGEGGPGGIW